MNSAGKNNSTEKNKTVVRVCYVGKPMGSSSFYHIPKKLLAELLSLPARPSGFHGYHTTKSGKIDLVVEKGWRYDPKSNSIVKKR